MVDMTLTDEQRLLREMLERLIAREHPPTGRAAVGVPRVWNSLAQSGLLALPFAETAGGMGAGGAEIAIVAEQFGRNLIGVPFLESAIVAGTLLEAAGKSEMIEALTGGAVFTLAHYGPGSRHDAWHLTTAARKTSDGYLIDGRKVAVGWGDCAGTLLVSAMLHDGMAVFTLDPNGPGVDVIPYETNDGRRAADLVLNAARVSSNALVLGPDTARDALAKAIGRAEIYLACEAAAIMRVMSELTRDYLGTRQQFGATLGSFQVIQHRLVDMFIETEQALSIALAAADAWNDPRSSLETAVSAARAYGARAARSVGQEAIQLHGGIGMARESAVSHCFRRLTMNGVQFGDADHNMRRFAYLSRAHSRERL